MLTTTPSLLNQSPYQHYIYGYPHKTAYRPLPPQSLQTLWKKENLDSLFLYIHIPFCEMRCGFCNLFTTVTHNQDFASQYVKAVRRQAEQLKSALAQSTLGNRPQFTRFALGGGTPTQLPLSALSEVFDIAENVLNTPLSHIPISVEVSPETATTEKLQILRNRHTTRISMGVQSFIDSEIIATQRRQTAQQVIDAIARIRQTNIPILNLDLIYGLPGQTVKTWLTSIKTALQFQPEEIYLYPLYVRPLTGLDLSNKAPDKAWDDSRLACYRAGREFLLQAGYQQKSMRAFQAPHYPHINSPNYSCLTDGMVGIGCGARSYTRSHHYSYDYAVNDKEIKSIISQYIATEDFTQVTYGFTLNTEEQLRRYLLLSLLSDDVSVQGINLQAYYQRFNRDIFTDLPLLQDLIAQNLLQHTQDKITLTKTGLERSDAIGPAFFSESVRNLMNNYQIK